MLPHDMILLTGAYLVVDFPGGDVVVLSEADAQKALIIAQVKIALRQHHAMHRSS